MPKLIGFLLGFYRVDSTKVLDMKGKENVRWPVIRDRGCSGSKKSNEPCYC